MYGVHDWSYTKAKRQLSAYFRSALSQWYIMSLIDSSQSISPAASSFVQCPALSAWLQKPLQKPVSGIFPADKSDSHFASSLSVIFSKNSRFFIYILLDNTAFYDIINFTITKRRHLCLLLQAATFREVFFLQSSLFFRPAHRSRL